MSKPLLQPAEDAYEAVRTLNHATIYGQALPAPRVYDLLGNLKNLGYGLHQLLGQVSDGLTRSLDEYDVYDHNRSPAESVALAGDAMREAAAYAYELGRLLAQAQGAINMQGYTEPSPKTTPTTAKQRTTESRNESTTEVTTEGTTKKEI